VRSRPGVRGQVFPRRGAGRTASCSRTGRKSRTSSSCCAKRRPPEPGFTLRSRRSSNGGARAPDPHRRSPRDSRRIAARPHRSLRPDRRGRRNGSGGRELDRAPIVPHRSPPCRRLKTGLASAAKRGAQAAFFRLAVLPRAGMLGERCFIRLDASPASAPRRRYGQLRRHAPGSRNGGGGFCHPLRAPGGRSPAGSRTSCSLPRVSPPSVGQAAVAGIQECCS
jgi:hypothetical protein